MRANPGADDISDAVADAVRKVGRRSNEELWPRESDRLSAEKILGPEIADDVDDITFEAYDRNRWQLFLDHALEYKSILLEMPADDLKILYSAEKAAAHKSEVERGNSYAEWAHFNLPLADASLKCWTELPSWTLDEAVALSLGKDPTLVTLESLKPYQHPPVSSFILDYNARRQRASATPGVPCQPGGPE